MSDHGYDRRRQAAWEIVFELGLNNDWDGGDAVIECIMNDQPLWRLVSALLDRMGDVERHTDES